MSKIRTLLYADDDPSVREIFKEVAGRVGFEVILAEDGPTAISKLDNPDIDVVFLDIRMPGMSGVEVCEYVRAQDDLPDLPVVFLTACDLSEVRDACYKAGGNSLVDKSECLQNLVEICEEAGIYKTSRLLRQNVAVSSAITQRLLELVEEAEEKFTKG